MSWKIHFIIFLLILLRISNINAQCPKDSLVEYEFLIFSSTSAEERILNYYNYAQYLKKNNAFKNEQQVLVEACKYYDSCHIEINHLLIDKILYELQLCSYYLKDNMSFAISYNRIHRSEIKDSTIILFSDYLNILLYIDLEFYNEAKLMAKNLFAQDSDYLENIFNTGANLRISDKKKNFLALLPPVGQIKLGYTKEGLASAILESGTFVLYIISYPYTFYLAGNLFVLPLFLRTYIGGMHFTKKLVEISNLKCSTAQKEFLKESLMPLLIKYNN